MLILIEKGETDLATSTESDEDDTQDRNEEPNSVELNLDKEQNIAKPSMLKWFCTLLAKIAMKHHLTQSAILSICCLISCSLLEAYLSSLIQCVSYHCSQILEFSFTDAVEDGRICCMSQ